MDERPNIVIGAGPIGRAIAFQLASQTDAPVNLADQNHDTIATARLLLDDVTQIRAITMPGAAYIAREARSIILATSWKDCRELVADLLHELHSIGRCTPIICVGRPNPDDPLISKIPSYGSAVVLGAGLEPGLVESLISAALLEFADLCKITTRCGGIPLVPVPPLNYSLTFGSRLPVDQRRTFSRINGEVSVCNRFENVSHLFVEGVGLLECFDDAMLPSTAARVHAGVNTLKQQTFRWPGFADNVRVLHRLGLLADDEVEIGGARLMVRHATEAMLSRNTPSTAPDQVVLNISVENKRGQTGQWTCVLRSSLEEQCISSMAFVTAVPVVTTVKWLSHYHMRGPIEPWKSDLACIGLNALNYIRNNHSETISEHSVGLMASSKSFGASNG